MKYYDILGGFLSSLILYLFMLGCGYFFGKVKLLKKEALVAFTKMVIEIFLPVYLFIHICRSTFTYNFIMNGVLIISFLFYLLIASLCSFFWAYFSKMDLRYRCTFICLTSFVDIRRLHYLYINSFCYFLDHKTKEERGYCSNLAVNSEVHTFFQGIIVWYVAFNLIRLDKTYARHSEELWVKINGEENNNNSQTNLMNNHKVNNNKKFSPPEEENEKIILTEEDKTKIKEIYNEHMLKTNPNLNDKDNKDKDQANKETNENNVIANKPQENNNNNHTIPIKVVGTESFYSKIGQFSKPKFCKNDEIWKEVVYIMTRPPIIALFIGFVVGFIRVIRLWLFDTTTPVYLFFDTFNNIANCNILIGLLIIGANLALEHTSEAKGHIEVRKMDFVAHLVFKIVVMPFFGVIFGLISHKFIPENRALTWSCFLQWFLPTSNDIMIIIQLKDINVRFVAICIFIQYFAQAFINDLIHLPAMMSILGVLE